MDAKALAKSKRAHSLRHTKKNNHHSASKMPSVSSGTASTNKKPAGEQVGENPRKTHGSITLPSNWDRYNEEIYLGSEVPSGESASVSTEFIAPKSKGADYAFLISEAKAQPKSNLSSDSFHSFSDNFEEFTQGFGPMLSVKGQSMLSWISEDDFDFDSDKKASGSYEAPFLSLNLVDLAEQLGKAKLSERLFLESEILLPPELLNDEIQAFGEDNDHVQNRASAVELDTEASSSLIQDIDESEYGQPYSESKSPCSTVTIDNSIGILKGSHSTDKNKDNVGQSQETDQKFITKPIDNSIGILKGSHSTDKNKDNVGQSQETDQKFITKLKMDSTARKVSTFEAANAEADLNILLDSFAETKFFESSNPPKKSGHRSEIFRQNTPAMSSVGFSSGQYALADIKKKGTDRMNNLMMSVYVDDDIDTSFKETANTTQADGGSLSHDQEFRDITCLPSDGSSKVTLQDDFDSWLDSI